MSEEHVRLIGRAFGLDPRQAPAQAGQEGVVCPVPFGASVLGMAVIAFATVTAAGREEREP